eukprot:jgi/Psemu1/47250/gm1.47250_g
MAFPPRNAVELEDQRIRISLISYRHQPSRIPTPGRPPLKEEAEDSNQGGGSTGLRDPAKTSKGKGLDDSDERVAQVGIS